MQAVAKGKRDMMPSLSALLRVIALLIGIGLPAFIATTLYQQYGQELANAELRAVNTTRALEQHAARTFETIDTYLQTVISLIGPRLDSVPPELLHGALRDRVQRSHHLNNILIFDRNGDTIFEALALPARPVNAQDRDYFQALRDGPNSGLFVGRPIIGRLVGRTVIPVARRMNNPDGSFAGVILAVLDPSAFQSVYDTIDNGPGATLTLWRGDGMVLVRAPNVPDLIGKSFGSGENYRRHVVPKNVKPFWAPGSTDGIERVIAYGFLDTYPLYVSTAVARYDALAGWYRSAITQASLAVVLTAVLVSALLLFAREVKHRQVSDAKVRESEQRFRLLAENTSDVIIWCDLDTTRRYVSPAAKAVFGYEIDELVGTRPIDFVHPDDAEPYAQALDDLTQGRIEQMVTCKRYRRKNDSWVWIEGSFSLTRDPKTGQATGYVASLRDITDRKVAEQQIAHMAVHDALTGLPNRTLFRDRLNHEILGTERHASSFAVLACDLDGFKAVNDTLGHPAGDALLRTIAERLKGVVRDGDTVARLGGDEFAIILCRLDHPQSASLTAQRVIDAVGQPVDLDGRIMNVGISIGIAVGPGPDRNGDHLFKNADIALYKAKAGGRNTYRFYEAGMDAMAATRNGLELDMRAAVRRGGFVLNYQPVIDLASNEASGFEALLRWQHPLRGAVSPAEFIPLAEETGLIVTLGAWALREACREAASWPGDLRVAVNVSAVQFQQPGLEESVIGALSASGLPAKRLELEITESVMMQDAEAVIACLHRLRAVGVRIALDDFGTGYSSLSYLRRFPFDKIKIDRSFIREIADPDAAAIVRAVVGLGTHLGTGITAEGVETAEQLEQVRQEGCTEVQGYLFSRPLPPLDALAFVRRQLLKAA